MGYQSGGKGHEAGLMGAGWVCPQPSRSGDQLFTQGCVWRWDVCSCFAEEVRSTVAFNL